MRIHLTYDMMLRCVLWKQWLHFETWESWPPKNLFKFMNDSMNCVYQWIHLISVSFTVMWQWPDFCWFHLSDPKTEAPLTMGLQLTELTLTGNEKGLEAHIFGCSVCTFPMQFAAWSGMTTSTRPRQQPELAGCSSESIIKPKLWNLVRCV